MQKRILDKAGEKQHYLLVQLNTRNAANSGIDNDATVWDETRVIGRELVFLSNLFKV